MSEERESYEIVTTTAQLPQTLDEATAQFRLYQQVCKAILDENDYASIRGRQFRKRSGWAKLRRAFNVSIEIVDEQKYYENDDWGIRFMVKASLPNGRTEMADGACGYQELAASNIAPTLHNIRAKALTRAKNRVTSDILGAGIVSAEEMIAQPAPEQRQTNARQAHWISRPEVCKRFWSWVGQELGLSRDEVHEALNVESIYDFQGTMQEAKERIEAWITQQIGSSEEQRSAEQDTEELFGKEEEA